MASGPQCREIFMQRVLQFEDVTAAIQEIRGHTAQELLMEEFVPKWMEELWKTGSHRSKFLSLCVSGRICALELDGRPSFLFPRPRSILMRSLVATTTQLNMWTSREDPSVVRGTGSRYDPFVSRERGRGIREWLLPMVQGA